MAAKQWMQGIVKAVPSGDALLIMGIVKGGPPPEKTITLSSLIAPRLARRDGKDEPFAWDSREYLRRKCIGKTVKFCVDYAVPSINREFGSVFLDETNLALDVVEKGWAKVRQHTSANADVSPFYEKLVEAEKKAQTDEVGIWTKTPGASEASIRNIPPHLGAEESAIDAAALLATSKGKPLPAIVDSVRDGSCLRLIMLPTFQFVQVFLGGVQCPSMGRRPPRAADSAVADAGADAADKDAADPAKAPAGDGAKADAATGSAPAVPQTAAQVAAAAQAAAAAAASQPEPFAREAKHFTEVRALHRDVRLVLEGVDKYGNLSGSVFYPEGDTAVDLAGELLTNGLAKIVEWSMAMMPLEVKDRLRSCEAKAKAGQLRIWKGYKPPPSNTQAVANDAFAGRVVEVLSGDTILVLDPNAGANGDGAERRVVLSSIRAPRIGNPRRGERPEPYGREAKEFLRQRLIGQTVNVTYEYIRKIPAPAGAAGGETDGPTPTERTMAFGSVLLADQAAAAAAAADGDVATAGAATTAKPGDRPASAAGPSSSGGAAGAGANAPKVAATSSGNIAEMLVARGFATVVRHREQEDRSFHYDLLIAAEARAIKGKKGLHSAKDAPTGLVNDVSQGPAQKSKQYLPFLQRGGKVAAVVDAVLSGHRYKLLIPKEGCLIAFSLAAARCPGRDEPFSNEAISFVRHRMLQRDVEIEIESMDRGGTFLGSLTQGKLNLALLLVQEGLATVHPSYAGGGDKFSEALLEAQKAAKAKKLRLWAHYVEKEAGAEEEVLKADASRGQEVLEVTVSEVMGGGYFYASRTSDEDKLANVTKTLASLSLDAAKPPLVPPKKGDLVAARFSVDGSWCRVTVVEVVPEDSSNSNKGGPGGGPSFRVSYVDYGNSEVRSLRDIRAVSDASLQGVPPLAQLCRLACVKVPPTEHEFGVEAASYLSEMVQGKTVMAKIVDREAATGKPGGPNPPGKGTGKGTGGNLLVLTLRDPAASTTVNAAMLQAGLAVCEKPRGPLAADILKLMENQEVARRERLNMWQYGDADSDEEEGGGGSAAAGAAGARGQTVEALLRSLREMLAQSLC
eukprot:jgi/Mesvir1/19941/Mv13205-RA.1